MKLRMSKKPKPVSKAQHNNHFNRDHNQLKQNKTKTKAKSHSKTDIPDIKKKSKKESPSRHHNTHEQPQRINQNGKGRKWDTSNYTS